MTSGGLDSVTRTRAAQRVEAEGSRWVDSTLAQPRDRREPGYGLRRLLALADAVAITVAFACATLVVSSSPETDRFFYTLLTIPVWAVLFKVYGLYDGDTKRVSHSTLDDIPRLFHALLVGAMGLWLAWRWLQPPEERLILAEGATFLLVGFIGVLCARQFVRHLPVGQPDRVLLVGGGPISDLIVRKLRARPAYRLEPIGYLRGNSGGERESDVLPLLGELDRIADMCRSGACERVIVVAGETDHRKLLDLVRELRTLNVPVSIVPDLAEALGPALAVDDIEGMTIFGLNPPVLSRSSRIIKRGMDVAIAAPLLVLGALVLVPAAITIRLTSSGPAIYRQERVGRRGRPFQLYKLRTMVADASVRGDQLKAESMHPAWLLLNNDPRITPVGKFLRRTSIDELPQLWNVIRGDMSLVGPRPITPETCAYISGWGLQRLDLTPGLTGLWQVLGRTSIPFEEMLKLDYLYVTNWSLWQDVLLLIRTLPAVLAGRGAN